MKSITKNYFWPLLLLSFGVFYYNLRILGFDFAYIPGDSGDSRFIHYLLEHGHRYLVGDHESFWSPPFMFPLENVLALSDHMILGVPVYSIFRFFTQDMESAYQLWWITISILNFVFAYYYGNKLLKNNLLSALLAFIFAFGTMNLWQMSYVQMSMRFFVPPAIYYAYQLVSEPSRRHLLLYFLFILLQFLSVVYTAFFLLYFTLGFIILCALVKKSVLPTLRFYFKKIWKETLVITLLFCLLLLALIYPYFRMSQDIGLKYFAEVKWNLPIWRAFIFPSDASIWHPLLTSFKPQTEHWWLQSTFTGVIPLVTLLSTPLLLILHYSKKLTLSSMQLVCAWTTCLIFLLFIRTENGYTLYALIFKLPGMNSMRVLNRFIVVWSIFLLLFLFSTLKSVKIIYLIPIGLLLLLDQSFNANDVLRTTKSELQARRIHIEKKLCDAAPRNKCFVVVNDSLPNYLIHLDAMMASFKNNIPTLNGYSSSAPNQYGAFFKSPTRTEAEKWIQVSKLKDTVLIIEY